MAKLTKPNAMHYVLLNIQVLVPEKLRCVFVNQEPHMIFFFQIMIFID